jgi:TRAP-type C4-dicarboxylate transport system permease small subunit
MSRTTLLILVALVINLALAGIIIYTNNGEMRFDTTSVAYFFGRGIIYWLRPFLFVGMVRFFYVLTNREFTELVAIGAYSGSWLILLVGMFYNYY